MLGITNLLNNIIYLIIALSVFLLINGWLIRELSVLFRFKETTFLPAFDMSSLFIVFLFIWSLIPNSLRIVKITWAIITFASVYYMFIRFYKIDWKEALGVYGVWLIFILLLGLGISKLAGY